MKTEKMSLTRVLAAIKTTASSIEDQIGKSLFIGITVGKDSNEKSALLNYKTFSRQEIADKIKSDVQSLEDKKVYLRALKSALFKANANTIVKIAGIDYTIMEAIDRKRMIDLEKKELNTIRANITECNKSIDRFNQQNEDKINNQCQSLYSTDRKNITEEQLNIVRTNVENISAPNIIDPMDYRNKIDSMITEYNNFCAEVDFCLSEINAKTEVEVTW